VENKADSINQTEVKKSPTALREEEILAFWERGRIFEKSAEKGQEEFIFYDGPPFATGLPHHGHILAGTIKDAIPRYQTMRGRKVIRRWGWDCHGLPIENIIEKELGLKTKKDIEALGVENFNQAARKEVIRYVDDWKKIIPRMGRWVNMENAYRTMDASYTESVWWSFKTLYDKGLIYQGFKGMQLCPRCETTLSNFEVALGYKDITDISVTVKLELVDESGTYLLAWTTTPWTLPGNMAAAVNSEIDYVKVESGGVRYILSKHIFDLKRPTGLQDSKIVKEFKGGDIIGLAYKPLFNYYTDKDFPNKENAWKVYGAPYVTTENGTGIVHIAPAFGAEDLELAQEKHIPIIHHVGIDGAFNKEVIDFAGLQVKPKDDHQSGDVLIIKKLALDGTLFSKEKVIHSYPHCWRCDTPLLNYAATSWFVNISKIKSRLIEENKAINWVPEHIGSGRFGNILESAPDWAISRARFWGAPLPVWQCNGCESRVIIGSLGDLEGRARKSDNRYFLMRHGESEGNIKKIVDSGEHSANHLTVFGIEEVRKSIKSLTFTPDLVVSSLVPRAKETAELIMDELNLPASAVISDRRLSEISFGTLEGHSVSDYDRHFTDISSYFSKKIDNAETWVEVRKRVWECLDEFDKKYKNKKILFVTHDTPALLLDTVARGENEAYAAKQKNNDPSHLFLKNAEVREVPFRTLPRNEHGEIDLHRPYIDDVALSCDCGAGLTRVPEVFDCWYESGSMPYAQSHYPFDTTRFNPGQGKGFPASFIAEGLDQTRGWFYSMLVLSTALFGKSAYNNVIVNGLILAEDGQKMSKRLKNYPDPVDMVNRFGADALRFYLLSSPVVRSEDLNFSERGVDEVTKKITSRLDNVLAFYEMYQETTSVRTNKSPAVLDRWILARLEELKQEVTDSMERYELDRATRPFLLFVDDLSTWYLRRSRERFKGDNAIDKAQALRTTRYVLIETAKLIAPFMPFLAESMFQKLRVQEDAESVHLTDWPQLKKSGGLFSWFNKSEYTLLSQMKEVRQVVTLGLEARAKNALKVRQPLPLLTLKSEALKGQELLISLIKDEVNVKKIHFNKDQEGEAVLDTNISNELRLEGAVRELIREIQDRRKEMKLEPKDRISVSIETSMVGIDSMAKEIGKAVNADSVSIIGNKPEQSISVTKL